MDPIAEDAGRHPPPPPAGGWQRLWPGHASWLDLLGERSYSIKMGTLHLAGRSLYIVNDPALARQVLELQEGSGFTRHPLVAAMLHPLLGESPLACSPDRRIRARVRLGAAVDTLAEHLPAGLEAAFPHLAQDWRDRGASAASSTAATLDVEPALRRLCVEALLQSVIGREATACRLPALLDDLARFERACAGLARPSLAALEPTRRWGCLRSSRVAGRIRRQVREMLAQRRRRWFVLDAETARPGWLEALEARESGDPGSAGAGQAEDVRIDQTATLLLTLHDQVASTLAWALSLVAGEAGGARASRLQESLRAEGAGWQPHGGPERPRQRAVVAETLRLYAPIPFIPRLCTRAQGLRDKMLDEGDIAIVSPWLLHRHRAYWDRPDDFDPDRFGPGLGPARPTAATSPAWLPFGWGGQSCPAAPLVQDFAACALGSLLRAFEFRAPAGEKPRPLSRWTLRPASGVHLYVRDRGAA